MPKKKQESEKSLSAKSTIHKIESPDIGYALCDCGYWHKYQTESRDKIVTFKCPKCRKIRLVDPKKHERNARIITIID